MEMIAAAEVHEDDDNYQSPLDILFERLEMREPDSIACKQYRIFKQAAGKTAKSILVSVGVRLAAFNLPSIAKLTMTDELHLQELGERKIALFCCIPDSDKSLNYLVGMIYTQLIQTLYRQADRVHKGRLPVPVHCLMDEYSEIERARIRMRPNDRRNRIIELLSFRRHETLDNLAHEFGVSRYPLPQTEDCLGTSASARMLVMPGNAAF